MGCSVKYDRFGFDKEGYNSDGFNKMGYNREGYDKEGYDIHGYSKDGFFKLTGLNKNGFNREGYNTEGYDSEGYDRKGFDRNGYDRDGYNKEGYNREGFNLKGYDKNGFDKDGYSKRGYDKKGFNRQGFNKSGYDKEGYDKDGFNSNGFDKDGYNRNGLDKEGYNREGFNKLGFNRSGYDRNGFDIYGYDIEGFNKLGFNKSGYNRDGYNEKGYDKNGFDREGFNIKGYNKEGYDKEGYDKEGYNKNGFDRSGYDKNGFNHKGYNIWGYNLDGYDKKGFDIWGYNIEGYDKKGFDRSGFNSEGYTIEGFHKSVFDKDGYHIFTGFNLNGFNREGFNINGIDKEGYDQDGYNLITGYNRQGFGRDGFNEEGIDSDGYDREGFDKFGYNRNGYDYSGFDKSGRNIDGYDYNGYDKDGYDINGFDKNGNQRKKTVDNIYIGDTIYHKDLGEAKVVDINKKKNTIYFTVKFIETKEIKKFCTDNFNDYLSFTPQKQVIDMINSYNEEDYSLEKVHLKETLLYISNIYSHKLKEVIKKDWNSLNRREKYIKPNGFVETRLINHDKEVENEYKITITKIESNPYFARVDFNNKSMYIGKHGIDKKVIDWSDKSCQYYYQYQMYLGSDDITLSLVRDLSISNGELYGYIDKYNIKGDVTEQKKYTDERLVKIIQANRENKFVHDIIQSIQANQYKIMTSDINRNIIVLGCAGSGKTMIMYHRLRYLVYNYKEIDLSSVYLISPTKILGVESHQLLKTLDITKANLVTVNELILDMLKKYYKNSYFPYNINIIDSIELLTPLEIKKKYNIAYADDIAKKIKEILKDNSIERKDFIENQRKKINDSIELFKLAVSLKDNNLEKAHNKLKKLCELYEKSKEECKKHSKDNIIAMKNSIIDMEKKYSNIYNLNNIIRYLLDNNCFVAIENEESKEKLKNLKNNFNKATENRRIKKLFEITQDLFIFFENVEEQYFSSMKFEKPVLALKHIIKEANISGCPISEDCVMNALKFLQTTTEDYANYILEQCDKAIEEKDKNVKKECILDLLSRSKYLGNLTRMNNGQAYSNFLEGFKSTFELFSTLGWNGSEIDKNYIINEDIKTPFDFVEKYRNVIEQEKRLNYFENGDKSAYLFDLIYEHIEPNPDCLDNRIIKNKHQLVLNAYICAELYGRQDSSSKYLFFDEFQDLSALEIVFFHKALPDAVYNYYGDLSQCITPKGIDTEEELRNLIPNGEVFYINENYRNALEITRYVNQKFGFNMLPIGISGKVIESNNFNELSINPRDRIAFIVKDKNNASSDVIKALKAIPFKSDDNNTIIPRGIPVIYSVQEVKGLEFESVVVDKTGLNVNEKYVAYTRALNNLFILK